MKGKIKTTPFDPAEHLKTPGEMAVFLSEALETGDTAVIAAALGVVARARGMREIAEKSGLSRESLYKALRQDGNPELATTIKVVQALGMKLMAKAA
ncbi:putative addiction module antidote protein [Vineibacter terrae]|uniref:Putative addiction module antidote protein n=1 Tax=Vineibacter terrae TaxID=2586908 RepID=A0A5C8PTW1_9HYPH|nr:addiction module antidote protein [Vineibacter terrae]TXL80401.1 putative addiction module antidote protein [Vineibacter terrae]